MSILEYDEEKEMIKIRRAEYEQGLEHGLECGGAKENIRTIRRKLRKGISPSAIAEMLELEEVYVKKVIHLIQEYPKASDTEIVNNLSSRLL